MAGLKGVNQGPRLLLCSGSIIFSMCFQTIVKVNVILTSQKEKGAGKMHVGGFYRPGLEVVHTTSSHISLARTQLRDHKREMYLTVCSVGGGNGSDEHLAVSAMVAARKTKSQLIRFQIIASTLTLGRRYLKNGRYKNPPNNLLYMAKKKNCY